MDCGRNDRICIDVIMGGETLVPHYAQLIEPKQNTVVFDVMKLSANVLAREALDNRSCNVVNKDRAV